MHLKIEAYREDTGEYVDEFIVPAWDYCVRALWKHLLERKSMGGTLAPAEAQLLLKDIKNTSNLNYTTEKQQTEQFYRIQQHTVVHITGKQPEKYPGPEQAEDPDHLLARYEELRKFLTKLVETETPILIHVE